MVRRCIVGSWAVFSLISAAAATGSVDDGRIGVVVLQVISSEVSAPGVPVAAEARAAIERRLGADGAFKIIPQPPGIEGEEGCRLDLRCIDAHLPRGAVAIDLRLRTGGMAGGPVAFDLRVIAAGGVLHRVSAFVARGELSVTVADAVEGMLSRHRPEIDLFQRALLGRIEAREELLKLYPDGAWTRTLLLIEAGTRKY